METLIIVLALLGAATLGFGLLKDDSVLVGVGGIVLAIVAFVALGYMAGLADQCEAAGKALGLSANMHDGICYVAKDNTLTPLADFLGGLRVR